MSFISLLSGAAAAWPLAARAQQQGVPLFGLLSGTQLDDRRLDAVRHGLKEAGYIQGRNIAIKYRSADGRFDRLPALAAALVADPAAVILTFGPPAAVALKLQLQLFRSYSRPARILGNRRFGLGQPVEPFISLSTRSTT